MRTTHFDRMAVGELTINFMNATPSVVVKAAFVNTTTCQTHGWTTNAQWSTATMEILRALRVAMEADLNAIHFVDGGTTATTPNTPTPLAAGPQPPEGLGEHLKDAPSV